MLISQARNGDEIRKPRHRGSPANIEVPAFVILVNPKLVWDSWNLACYHGAASTCRDRKIVPFGAGLGISFSEQAWCFRYGTWHLWGRNDIRCLLLLSKISSVNIEQQECCVQFWNFSGFVWPFLYINWVSGHLMCIIQIWTTWTCTSAPKLVEKSHVCPWVNF